jgi:Ca2+-binding EF-hand superfamily protein
MFLVEYNSLLIVQLRIVKEVFELFDTDGQNELDEEELASALYALGFSQEGHFEVTSNHVMTMS